MLVAAIATGAAVFAVRLAIPTGREIAHMQLGDFASFYALWEPLVAWGIILALLAFFRIRVRADRLRRLSRRAYAIDCFHPPVVVGISVALRHWLAPPALKYLAVGSRSCGLLYVVTGPVLGIPPVARMF